MIKQGIQDIYYEKIKKLYNYTDQITEIIDSNFRNCNWEIHKRIQWIYIRNIKDKDLMQGWKIHLSATHLSAINVLKSFITIALKENVSFKVSDTLETLKIMNDSHYPRGYSGKFITIYPNNEEQFKRIVQDSYQLTKDLSGPIILSDRHYAGIVHYRYGAFKSISKIDSNGKRIEYITDPNGNLFEDKREAWFALPPWLDDPFQHNAPSNEFTMTPPYQFIAAVRHANKGGVYIAKDCDNKKIIVKEARKHVGTDDFGNDFTDYLENEKNILIKLADTNSVPKFINFYKTENNSYLIEEYLEGSNLYDYINKIYREKNRHDLLDILVKLSIELIYCVQSIHSKSIIIRDLSRNNIMVTADGKIYIIDFEISYDVGGPLYVPNGGTPAYFYYNRSNIPTIGDDVYSVGSVLFFIFSNRDPIFFDDEERNVFNKQCDFLDAMRNANYIPVNIVNIIKDLLNPDLYCKLKLENILTRLLNYNKKSNTPSSFAYSVNKNMMLKNISVYLLNSCNFNSTEQIWEKTPFGNNSSKTCIQNGVAGVGMLILQLIELELCDKSFLDKTISWLIAHYNDPITRDSFSQYKGYENSLYFGKHGVLWFLLEAGQKTNNKNLVDFAVCEALKLNIKSETLDIALGMAGYAMSNLNFYIKTREYNFLTHAIEVADSIINGSVNYNDGCVWPLNNKIFYGYAHGNAGICHFLLLMFAITKKQKYLDYARKGYKVIFDNAIINTKTQSASWTHGPNNFTNWPHWCNGSSGIGSSLIRMYKLTNEQPYLDYAIMAANDVVNRIWNISTCQCHGLVGNAEFILDMFFNTKEKKYYNQNLAILDLLYVLRFSENNLKLFYNETGQKASSDYGTGISGIGTYLYRCIKSSPNRLFMIDEILYGNVLEV